MQLSFVGPVRQGPTGSVSGETGVRFRVLLCAAAVVTAAFLGYGKAGAATPDDLLRCSSLSQTITKPDGSIVGVGETASTCGYNDISPSPTRSIVLVQIKSDGSIDDDFANGGVALLPTADNEKPVELVPAGGGDVILVTTNGIRRFDPDGSPGTNIGVDNVGAAAIQDDGKVLVAVAKTYNTTIVTRFDPNGKVDETFGTDGRAEHQVSTQQMTIDHEGRIILAWSGGVLRLLPGGTADPAFGPNGDGLAATSPFLLAFDGLAEITVDGDGVIRLYGEITDGGYGFYGYRATIDADGNPVPAESGEVGGFHHAGHGFAEMSDGGLAFSVFPGRGEEAEFSFAYSNVEPLRLNLSPGTAAVLGISSNSDGTLLAVGSASGPSCLPRVPGGRTHGAGQVGSGNGGAGSRLRTKRGGARPRERVSG